MTQPSSLADMTETFVKMQNSSKQFRLAANTAKKSYCIQSTIQAVYGSQKVQYSHFVICDVGGPQEEQDVSELLGKMQKVNLNQKTQ